MNIGVPSSVGVIFFASLLSFVFGFLWYSPMLFGNLWMRLNGVKPPKDGKMPKGMGRSMFISFVGSVVSVYVISLLIGPLGLVSFVDAFKFAFLVWAAFFGSTVLLGSVLWDKKPWSLWLLNGVYWFLNTLLVTVVLL